MVMLQNAVQPQLWMNALHVRTRSLCSPCRCPRHFFRLVWWGGEFGCSCLSHHVTGFGTRGKQRIAYILSNLSIIYLYSFHSYAFFIYSINDPAVVVAQVRKNADSGEVIHTRQSRFYFADLGGSEQLSKSKVDAATKAKVTVPRLHARNHFVVLFLWTFLEDCLNMYAYSHIGCTWM